ncbi:glycoside hydrolase family 2 protein [Novipirellula artificiosorum]|uniref:Beta-glucuronidase n=1 Tax=Novipirellula artificiosorum TaxID=2528016 RepID=A0A5C6D8W3_9BACT|nr:sugar-binding domain-containing protein [Novipirellula artificiosorum]TWU33238.1 Beta-glucuronidase [Novipirellula artificiosorum]
MIFVRYTASLAIVCSLLSHSALAEPTAAARQHVSLDGTWEIAFDAGNKGRAADWHRDAAFSALVEKQKIPVPSCWEELEKDYEGVAYYRRKFTVPKDWNGKVVRLHFDAVNFFSEVWVNNTAVGTHDGGFTPFEFRVDDLLRLDRENTLVVRVAGPILLQDKRIDGVGKMETPQWRGGITGGIWQSVRLVATDSVYVEDTFIEPKIADDSAALHMQLSNTGDQTTSADVEIVIRSTKTPERIVATLRKKYDLKPGLNQHSETLHIPDATYWSPDDPHLYRAEVRVVSADAVSDKWTTRFGMREFTIRNKQFYLNGKPLYLKATFFEGLYPTGVAYPDSREMAIREIRLAKEAGFNMIRPWRKPPPPMWLDLADELGVLTVGSLVVECMGFPSESARLPGWVENEVSESILRDRNRACVVQWELFNELKQPVLKRLLRPMAILSRQLDPTRLILDESGGWAQGANMYLPYQSEPVKFNDVHFYPGGQVNQSQYDRILLIGKTKEEQRAMGLAGLPMPGKNVQPGLMSYLSELGYASWPDIVGNNAMFRERGNPILPATVTTKNLEKHLGHAFKRTGFDKAFPDLRAYCLEEQRIHGIANKRMIEATRTNPEISGYCIHALTDGDWILGAAILDLWRNPKTLAYEMTKQANQPQIVSVHVIPRNVYAGQEAKVSITGINELRSTQAIVTVHVESLDGKTLSTNTLTKDFQHGISDLYTDLIKTDSMRGSYRVRVDVKDPSGRLITSNQRAFDVFEREQIGRPTGQVSVVETGNTVSAHLKNNGIKTIPFSSDLDLSCPVVIGAISKATPDFRKTVGEVKEFVTRGGYAICLDVAGPSLTWGAPNPEPKPKDDDGSWSWIVPRVLTDSDVDQLPLSGKLYATEGNYISRNHIVTDHPVFDGLPTNELMSGVYENVCANKSICRPNRGQYISGVITYDQHKNMDNSLRHYNGIGDVLWAADVLLVTEGNSDGKILYSTLRIMENLGKDPVADKLLVNMLNQVGQSDADGVHH